MCSVVSIWKATDMTRLSKFEGHTGAITALAFSENGYYLGKRVSPLFYVTLPRSSSHTSLAISSLTMLDVTPWHVFAASASEDSTVKLWDLRKLKNFHTIEFHAGHEVRAPWAGVERRLDWLLPQINALSFDSSGSYLAVGGSDVR